MSFSLNVDNILRDQAAKQAVAAQQNIVIIYNVYCQLNTFFYFLLEQSFDWAENWNVDYPGYGTHKKNYF